MTITRHGQSIGADTAMRAKYDLMNTLCRAIELNEGSFMERTQLFTIENMSIVSVEVGYTACGAYHWLMQNGGIEGYFELQSILQLNEIVVRQRIEQITAEFIVS